jgi:hypothetical protein
LKAEPGKWYKAKNQGTNITPQDLNVFCVWANNNTVWYRCSGSLLINHTDRSRFEEIVNLTK